MADGETIGSAHKYYRVLLKISGESLMGHQAYGIDTEMVASVAMEVKNVVADGVEVCLVIGGGNIFRGCIGCSSRHGTRHWRLHGHRNCDECLAMQNALEQLNVPVRVMSALPISAVCEPYIRRRAKRHLEKGRVVIFAAGTGNRFLRRTRQPH